VYKGVVPARFGADALGGVVNVVTAQRRRTFVDASYSFGSFNTHKAYVNAGYTSTGGLTIQLNAFANYSDNDYPVYTKVLDLATNTFSSEEQRVRRFHDTYHNETAILKAGIVGKPFADRLLFSLTLGQSHADIQNSNIMKVVFGERFREGTTFMPAVQYLKRNLLTDGLDLHITANYNNNASQNTDTSSLRYNWRGESIETGKKGEVNYSLSRYENHNGSLTTNLSWHPASRHALSFNDVLTAFERTGSNSLAMTGTINATDTFPKYTLKNVSALDYTFTLPTGFNFSLFAKHYHQYTKGPRNVSTASHSSSYQLFSTHSSTFGAGGAATYILGDFQLKASYEKTYRLPTANELFGNEDLEKSATELRPEYSHNYNLSLSFTRTLAAEHALFAEVALSHRNINDYIRRVVENMHYTAAYENHGKVLNSGINAEVRYTFRRFALGSTFTYQDVRNKEKYRSSTSTVPSTTYDARVPNLPYLFGNADASFSLPDVGGRGNILSFAYNALYVHTFPLRWGVNGFPETKDVVPTQFAHDLSATYALRGGRYNLSLECRNLTDARLYDNFSLQKPGRSFAVKLRYYFSK
jgi:outer membrane receptor protein involved in Fe transport